MDWKNNKRIQIAVGLAVVVLAFRWLFSNTLSDAALAYSTPPLDEGQVGDPATALAMIWPFVELAMVILGAIGLYVLNLGDWIWSQMKGVADSEVSIKSIAPATEKTTTNVNPEVMQRNLARAVAMNDDAEIGRLRVLVRRPYALGELVDAVNENDFSKAETLFGELRGMYPPATGEAK